MILIDFTFLVLLAIIMGEFTSKWPIRWIRHGQVAWIIPVALFDISWACHDSNVERMGLMFTRSYPSVLEHLPVNSEARKQVEGQREKAVELHGYGSMRTAWPSWLFRTTPCLTVLICASENSWPFLYEDDFPATELSFLMNFSRLCWTWECSRVPDQNKCIVLLCFTLFYYVRGRSVYFPANAVVGTQVPKHLMVNPQGTSHYFSVQCH